MTNAPESHELLLALRKLRTAVATVDRDVAATAKLRDSDLTVLDVLHREGRQTPTDLARRTRTHLATMTGVLARLEKEGWIERRSDSRDRRSIGVHATSVERFRALYAEPNARLAALFAEWPADQASIFLASVEQVVRALDEEDEA